MIYCSSQMSSGVAGDHEIFIACSQYVQMSQRDQTFILKIRFNWAVRCRWCHV